MAETDTSLTIVAKPHLHCTMVPRLTGNTILQCFLLLLPLHTECTTKTQETDYTKARRLLEPRWSM